MRTLPLLFLALIAHPSSAQTATCLLQEDGPLVGGPPGETVDALNNTAVNQQGGFAVTTNTTDGLTTTSRVWGASAAGGAGATLLSETQIGDYLQTSFESNFGLAGDGTVAYSATVTDTSTGTSGLDSAWLGATPLAVADEPIPTLPGKVWRFASRVDVTEDGQPWWFAGINDAGGANEGAGLFFGTGATVMYKTGDVIAGLPAPLASSPVDFDSRFSALGKHHLVLLDTSDVPGAGVYLAIDGVPLDLGGPVGEGEPCNAVGALPGESWDNFDSVGITDGGHYFFSGDTNGATATDEFLCVDGEIVRREGDTVDGAILTGAMEGAFLSEAGNLAYVWDRVEGGGDVEALFVDNRLLLSEGDAVDFDGDGTVDPAATVSGFTGITSMTLGADRVVYVTADVDTLGTASTFDDTECLLAVTDPGAPDLIATPPQIFLDTGGTQNLFVRAPASLAGDFYWVLGTVTGTSPGFPLGLIHVPLNPDAYLIITLTKPNLGPLVNTLGSLDADANATAAFAFGPSLDPLFVGLELNHAYIGADAVNLTFDYASSASSLLLTL